MTVECAPPCTFIEPVAPVGIPCHHPKMLITPRPGANRDSLLQALRQAHVDVRNLYTSGDRDTLKALLAYLEWANNATSQLAGQVSDRDLDRLILTARHSQILANLGMLAAPDTARFANGLLNLELRQRTDDFDAAVRSLEAAVNRRRQAGRDIVFDTGVFINHPEKLEAIDFRELTDVYDSTINLGIPMVVIDELDNLKQGKSDVRWRAGYSLAVIDRLFSSGRPTFAVLHEADLSETVSGGLPQPKVTVELLFDPPGHARLPIADDEIVDRVVALQALAGDAVTLFTYDTGQSTRARNAGLSVRKLVKADPEPQGKA
ncbi:PIN domain-containing protein [Kitasatospora sp. NPDC059408]|uniref:PIN domain-containing protein n=1 Tax=Kitasatospora sp. NPDC059408 TaxID=3346823 RepID=UPI0036748837